MTSEYFGLVMDPFERGPDTRFLYMEPVRRNAFAQLMSSVYEGRGLVLLTCGRGLGKSTLIRHLAEQLSALDSVLVLYPGGVLNCRPGMTFADVLAACRGRFDRRDPAAADEDRLISTLERAAGRGQAAVLMLDDADALDDDTLLRLSRLTEPDDDDRQLLSVILAGSEKLARRLEHLGGGETLAGLVVALTPLRDRDVDRLIRHRLTVAGQTEGDLFSPVALAEVARRTRGNPMRINALCQAAMALAERESKPTVSRDLVERAVGLVEPLDDDDGLGDDDGRDLQRRPSARRSDAAAAGVMPVAEGALPPPHAEETTRRLDDVAEAIRAADRRSTGGADPHIRYAPSRGSPGADVPPVEPEWDRGAPGNDSRRSAEPPRPFADEHRFYPGVRPSEPYRQRQRGWLAKTLVVGLLLALIVAGGVYGVRTGLVDFGGVGEQVQTAAGKVVHLVGKAIRPDPVVEEGVAGDTSGSAADERAAVTGRPSDAGAQSRSTSLAFDRFGSPSSREETVGAPVEQTGDANASPPVEAYDFAPPPPQAPRQEGAGRDVAEQTPLTPPASPSPVQAQPQPQPQPQQPPAASPAGSANSAGANDGSGLLDPGNATVLSRLGPPETPKPTPPPQPDRTLAAVPPPQSAPPATASPPAAAAPPPQSPPATASPSPPAAAAPPPQSPPATQGDPGRSETRQAQTEPLLARGDEYLVTADLDMARTFYQMAYERGSAEAALRMGWTFDPQYYQRAGVRGEASPREAILWYQEALRRGSRQASARLSALATWLQSAAASGDQEAQRILRLWQG